MYCIHTALLEALESLVLQRNCQPKINGTTFVYDLVLIWAELHFTKEMHFLRDFSRWDKKFLTSCIARNSLSSKIFMHVQAPPTPYDFCDNLALSNWVSLFTIFLFYLNIASPNMRKILHLLLLLPKQTRKFPFKTENQNTVTPVSLKGKTYLILSNIKSK